jgi:hypothetical protein
MKMIKNIKSILLVLCLVAFSTQSCNDYLDEKLVSDVTAKEYYKNAAGMEDAVDATYSFLREVYSQERAYMLSVFGTDTHTHGADGGWKGFNLYDNTLNSSSAILLEQWTFLYQGINQANAVLARIDAVPDMTEEIKTRRKAEVRFLRAFYYFYLVQTWGDVHLTLEETVAAQVSANNTSEATIYSDAIVPDLEFAIANLPATQSNYGRITKPAAQFLLGKVYLTRGYKTFKLDNDFTQAETLFTNVIADYNFALVPSHKDLWDMDKQQNSEIVWAVQYSNDVILNGATGNRGHLYFGSEYDVQPGMIRDIANGRPFKRFRPTDRLNALWAAARPNDQRYEDTYKQVWYCNDDRTSGNGIPLWSAIHVEQGAKKADGSIVTAADIGKRRFEVGDTALYYPGPGQDAKWKKFAKFKVRYTVITEAPAYYTSTTNPTDTLPSTDPTKKKYTYYTGTPFAEDAFRYNERLFPTITKFFDPRRPTIQWEPGSRDWFVMRLADAHLLRAEARLHIPNLGGAADDINVVRTRAAKPGKIAAMQITPAQVTLDFILQERALELDAEQCRWFDLVRTGKLVEYVTAYNPQGKPNIQNFHVLRPIPLAQIDRTVGGYKQNIGY